MNSLATTYAYRSLEEDGVISSANNPYAQVYAQIIGRLKSEGYSIKRLFSFEQLSREILATRQNTEDIIDVVRDMIELEAEELVFHDPDNFLLQIEFSLEYLGCKQEKSSQLALRVSSAVNRVLFEKARGSIERVHSQIGETNWDGELSKKDIFFFVCEGLGIPTPRTKVLANASDLASPGRTERLSEYLNKGRGGDMIIKEVMSSGGKGIHVIRNNRDARNAWEKLKAKTTNLVAQEIVPLPAGVAYSIRVVTWGKEVIGAALLTNVTNGIVSNAHQGGSIAFDLGLPGRRPRTNNREMLNIWHTERSKYYQTAEFCEIDLDARSLPNAVYDMAVKIGDFPSNALLKGSDFMYDRSGKPVAIESNYHPGPPGTGMFSSITGSRDSSRECEIGLAVRSISKAILSQ